MEEEEEEEEEEEAWAPATGAASWSCQEAAPNELLRDRRLSLSQLSDTITTSNRDAATPSIRSL